MTVIDGALTWRGLPVQSLLNLRSLTLDTLQRALLLV